MGGNSTGQDTIKKTIFNITRQKPVYKLSNRVFMYDDLVYDNKDLLIICSTLDKGIKFVPNFIDNEYNYFKYILTEIDSSLERFNGSIFFNNLDNDKNDPLEDLPLETNLTENQLQLKRSRKIDFKKFN
jgi:hypothetical protein